MNRLIDIARRAAGLAALTALAFTAPLHARDGERPAAQAAKNPVEMTVACRVVGPDDKAVADATVVVAAWAQGQPLQVLGQARTGKDGRVREKVKLPAGKQALVLASGTGYG